jgi:NitT/TauT family transport system substrate-binding protein
MASVLALSLSACGSGDDGPADENGLPVVRVTNAGMIPAYEDVVWGIEGGFFEKAGVKVKMTPPIYSQDALNALMNGDAELSLITATNVASARAAGRPLKVVGATQVPYPLEVVFTDETDEKLRAQGLSETSDIGEFFEALEGLTLGTSPVGSSINSSFRFLMSERGIDPEKDNITLQAMPDIPSQVAAMANGKVDGLVSSLGGASTGTAARGVGVVWSLTTMSGNESLNALPYVNIATSDSFIKEKPEAIQAFLDGLREAQRSLRDGISAEDDAALKELMGSEMDQKIYDDTIEATRELFSDDYTTSEPAFDVVLKVAEVTSDEPLKVSFEDVIDNTFAEKVK